MELTLYQWLGLIWLMVLLGYICYHIYLVNQMFDRIEDNLTEMIESCERIQETLKSMSR